MSDRVPHQDGKSTPEPPPPIPDHTLIHRIDTGAYGEVWLARNALGQGRAVKIVRRSRFKDPRPYEREVAGIQHYEPVSRTHEGLMDILQVGPEHPKDWFYYVMELADDAGPGIPGTPASALPTPGFAPLTPHPHPQPGTPHSYVPKTLHQVLHQQGCLPVSDCVRLGLSLCRALEHLHGQGLVHRDLKPSNVIYVDGIPKLSDPGLVAGLVEPASFVGTTGFVAPEGPGKPAADIYSLGVLLYAASTGKRPGDFPEPPSNLTNSDRREDWAELNSIILKASANNPGNRYSSAAAMREELERLKGGRSVRQLRVLQRRIRQLAVALSALALVAVLVLVALARQRSQSRRDRAQLDLLNQLRAVGVRGWREAVLDSLRAVKSQPGDLVWRSEAVAALGGMDAQLELYWKAHPARSIAFNSHGLHFVVGGPSLPSRWVALAPERVLAETKPGALAVGFGDADQPIELREDSQGELVVVSLKDSRELCRLQEPLERETSRLPEASDTPDGRYRIAQQGTAVAGIRHGRMVVWNLPSGDVRWSRPTETAVFAWDNEGQIVALAEKSGEIQICRTGGDGEDFRLPASRRADLTCLALGRDPVRPEGSGRPGWLLAAGDSGGVITIWDLTRRVIHTPLLGSHLQILALAFSPDSTLLASGGRAEMRLWDVATGRTALSGLDGDFHEDLCFSPDGVRIGDATRTHFGPGAVHVWSLDSGRGIRGLRGLTSGVYRPVFSPDGRRVVGVSNDWQLGLWDVGTGRLLWARGVPVGFSPDNLGLAFTLDGAQLAYVSGRSGRMWNSDDGRELRAWDLPPGMVESLVFDEQGRLMSFRREANNAADVDREGRFDPRQPQVGRLRNLLALDSLKPLLELTNFSKGIASSVLSPDGRVLIIAGTARMEDGTSCFEIRAMDTVDGGPLWSLPLPSMKENTGGRLVMDHAGKVLGVHINHSQPFVAMLEVRTGKRIESRIDANAIALGGRRMLREGQSWGKSDFGFTYFELGKPELVLIPSETLTGIPAIDRSGTQAVWPGRDGTLQVCNFEQVRQELQKLGIPW